jgi:hypothetical protein
VLAHHRSLGFVAWSGPGASIYRETLEGVIAEVEGTQAFHHAIVDRMAHERPVHAITFAHGIWREIDRPEDIASWAGAAQGDADGQRLPRASGDD